MGPAGCLTADRLTNQAHKRKDFLCLIYVNFAYVTGSKHWAGWAFRPGTGVKTVAGSNRNLRKGTSMLAANYKTKKLLKESVGEPLLFTETSLFGEEYQATGKLYVVGPAPYDRRWYAEVWMSEGLIIKVK